jgi:hypothetical protein
MPLIMDEDDRLNVHLREAVKAAIILDRELLLDAACRHMEKTGAIRTAPKEVRSYWGKVRAQKRKQNEPPSEQWKI